jgi:predicted dehydrogenase
MSTRVGIIGCGSISRFHHEGYARAGAKIVHVCDLRREAAEPVAARYGARWSTDYRAVLGDPEVELVSILTVASTHKEICLAAIAAGKGVVCEKTLADNAADAATISVAAGRAKAWVATAYMKNFFPATQRARELLADMGPVISIHARTWQPFGSLWDERVPDLAKSEGKPSELVQRYGGGVLVCGGSHIINLIHGFGGRAVKVCGASRSRAGVDFDIQTNALLWLEGGGMAHLEACWHPLAHVGFERNGWDERIEINTPKGRLDLYTVKWDQPLHNGALLVHQDASSGRVTEHRFPAMNPFDAEMASMISRFQAGQTPFPSAWDGYAVDEVLAQIAASAREGTVRDVSYADRR